MVFPIIMYGCESWTIKKAEHWWIIAFDLFRWRRFLWSPLDCEEIKPVNSPEYSVEELMLKLKLQYFGHLMWRADSLENTLMQGKIEGRIRRGWQRTTWFDGITESMDMRLSKFSEMVKNREAWHAAAHRIAKNSVVTEQQNEWNLWKATLFMIQII